MPVLATLWLVVGFFALLLVAELLRRAWRWYRYRRSLRWARENVGAFTEQVRRRVAELREQRERERREPPPWGEDP